MRPTKCKPSEKQRRNKSQIAMALAPSAGANAACKGAFLVVCVLASLVVPLLLARAQKTIGGSNFRQSSLSSSSTSSVGSGPAAVYGGYQSSSQQVNRRVTKQQVVSRPAPVVQQQQQESYYSESSGTQTAEADSEPASYGSVNGQPGRDFPAYTQVPKTSFSCDGLPYEYGMYADEETGCQAYHVCYNGRKDSFLCGVGTVFNQRILHCDYWYSVDCGKSSQYYSSNEYMGSSQPEPGPAQAGGSSYRRTESSSAVQSVVGRPASPVNNYQRPQGSSSSSSSFSQNSQQQQIQEPY